MLFSNMETMLFRKGRLSPIKTIYPARQFNQGATHDPLLVDRGPGRPALGQTLGQTHGPLAAFAAGLLLALMIAQNGAWPAPPTLARSWLAHGVGTLVAGSCGGSPQGPRRRRQPRPGPGSAVCRGAHRGAGGPVPQLALGMAGTLALLLLGQLLFGALWLASAGSDWLAAALGKGRAALLVMAGAPLIVLRLGETP